MCHVLISVYHEKNGFSILVGDIFEDESANVCGSTLGTKGTACAVPFDYVIPEFRAMREYSHACCLFALVFVVFLSHEILPRGVIHVMVFFFGENVDRKDANIFTPFFDQSRSYISGSIRFSGTPYIS